MQSPHRAEAIDYDETTEAVEAWKVADDGGAEWAIRKIAAAELRIHNIRKLAESERARLEHWEATATKADQQTIEALTEKLTAYHAEQLAADPARKSIKLPHGTLSARKQPPAWEFNEDPYLVWASKHAPDTIKHPAPCIDKAAAKKAAQALLEATGEVPPGATPIERGVSFTVKTV